MNALDIHDRPPDLRRVRKTELSNVSIKKKQQYKQSGLWCRTFVLMGQYDDPVRY